MMPNFRLSAAGAAVFSLSLAVLLCGVQPAQASSSDAWEEFQQEVEAKCRSAANVIIQVNRIHVDPYGSESYGFALMIGPQQGSPAEGVVVCAFNKQTREAEISGFIE